MNVETIREYCIAKQDVTEGFPFGPDPLVFKVKGKMFALMNLEGQLRVNLKCDPERAIELREQHKSILPGWHMNKTLWNTVIIDGSLSEKLIKELIDHSYTLIRESIKK